MSMVLLPLCTDVPKPSQYGLPFEDLTLETRDNIRIKAYLMVQRKILPAAVDAAHIVEQDEEDHAVRTLFLLFRCYGYKLTHSFSTPAGDPL
jgi:hypothetical protein